MERVEDTVLEPVSKRQKVENPISIFKDICEGDEVSSNIPGSETVDTQAQLEGSYCLGNAEEAEDTKDLKKSAESIGLPGDNEKSEKTLLSGDTVLKTVELNNPLEDAAIAKGAILKNTQSNYMQSPNSNENKKETTKTLGSNTTAGTKKKPTYKNVYCMPVKPQRISDDDIFSKKNRHVFFGKCPCCE